MCSKDAAVEAEDGDLSAKDLRVAAGVLKDAAVEAEDGDLSAKDLRIAAGVLQGRCC